MPIASGPRMLLAAGGTLETFLTDGEFVSVRLTNIQDSDTQQSIREAMQRYGTVTEVVVRNFEQREGGGGPRWAKVSYTSAAAAAQVLARSRELQPWRVRPKREYAEESKISQVR